MGIQNTGRVNVARIRCVALMAASSSVVLLGASGAHAQAQGAAAKPAEGATLGEIVVTASRINQAGFTAPTPTTVITTQAIQQVAQPNLFTVIAELPALQGSTGVANGFQNGNTSIGSNGLSSLNMRGLGTIRTLSLLDGQRVVGAYFTGVTDVSLFPQLLIQRVDVVTGGASASWGSDAISGVVNFVTDKHLDGFKSNVQYGQSTYGDAQGAVVQAAVGHAFMNDRLHLEASAEYYNDTGVGAPYFGGKMPSGRPDNYRSGNTSYAFGANPAGAPQYYYYPYNTQDISYGAYGLITAGPLQGTAFSANGATYPFQYGGSGVPAKGSTAAVNGCVGAICQGGEMSNWYFTPTTADPLRRGMGYGRIGFDLLPNVEIYSTLTYADVNSRNQPLAAPRKPGLTIQCSNPFLPSSVVAACAANKITSFLFGTENQDVPGFETIYTGRQLRRFVLGSDGSFNFAGKPISFDTYYEHGESYVDVEISNMTLTPHYNAAINPVLSNGQIVCNGAAAQASGCVPWNVFGYVQNSAAAWNYLAPAHGPFQHTLLKQDAFSASFNMTPFKDWAGDVSLAAGGEWRREFYKVRADPYGNGVDGGSPNSANYPADPTLSTAGANWFAGNYHNGGGEYSVGEAFVELGVPLWDAEAFGKANLNVAGRWTDYSTSGTVYTWKAGGTWDTPLEGLRIRGVHSRDIRAPNLSELFAAPITQSATLLDRANKNANVQLNVQTIGNPALKPEISDNNEIGVVYQPKWLRGLSLSLDYFDINVQGAISTLSAQQEIDLCYNGNQAMCSNVKLTGKLGTPDFPFVLVQPFNLASLKTNGIDLEASYRFNLDRWHVPGSMTLRGLATRTLGYVSNPGISGQIIQQFAGDNAADTPYWKANLAETWANGPLSLNVTERVISDGKINPNYIECQAPNCPVSTIQNPTINFNRIPGAVYVDLGGSYQWNKATQFYFKLDNLFNYRVPPFGSSTIYDMIGRTWRIGARFTH